MKLSGKCFCGAVEIETSGAPEALRKEWRGRVLPAEDPRAVKRGLADAFAALAWKAAA